MSSHRAVGDYVIMYKLWVEWVLRHQASSMLLSLFLSLWIWQSKTVMLQSFGLLRPLHGPKQIMSGLLDPTGHSISSPFFFSVCLFMYICVCSWCAPMYLCMFACVWVHSCMDGNVSLNPELLAVASFNRQLALGSYVAGVQAGSQTHQIFQWVMEIQALVLLLMEKTL